MKKFLSGVLVTFISLVSCLLVGLLILQFNVSIVIEYILSLVFSMIVANISIWHYKKLTK